MLILKALLLVVLLSGVEMTSWWKTATIYQIYPRSFKDSNNDGIGDLRGIIEKLPYIKETGISAIWLSPIFKSPQVDQGYDISDYRDVDPDFGTLNDLKELITEAHAFGIKVILDFVPNHTSNQHQWFKDSINRKEGFEDFYVWHDGLVDEDGNRTAPNNWVSAFKGSAWTWNEERQQYYLHQFAEEQPDLNYRNPEVVKEVKDILIYWLDFGVDGFRVDAIPFLFEDEEFRDDPKSDDPNIDPEDFNSLNHLNTLDLNETIDMIYQFREVLDKFSEEHGGEERVLFTEAYSPFETILKYHGTPNATQLGAHFSFNFDLITNLSPTSNANDLSDIINKWIEVGTTEYSYITFDWVIGNHDQNRVATRLGPKNVDIYNMLIAMLKGVAITYNGEEIGQENGEVTCEEGFDPKALKDCSTFDKESRDFARTPFQWDSSVNAGFNNGAKPWLPVSENFTTTNLEAQNVPGLNSHYNIYKKLQEIRKEFQEEDCSGEFSAIALTDFVLQVTRKPCKQEAKYILVINLSEDSQDVILFEESNNSSLRQVQVASVGSKRKEGDSIPVGLISLEPHEGLVIKTST